MPLMLGHIIKDIRSAIAQAPGGASSATPVDLAPVIARLDAIQSAIGAQPSAASAGLPPGWLQAFLPTAIPDGFVPCDGRAISIADHPGLFEMLGHTYSNVPDEITARAQATRITPTMTSNTAPSGTAAASSVYSSTYDAWQAFNGSSAEPSGWVAASGVTSAWISYTFPAGQVRYLTAYGITPRANGSDISAPAAWTLEALKDGAWVILDSRAGVTGWASGVEKLFELDASKLTDSYGAFRLNVSAKAASGTYVGVGELRLLGLSTMPMLTAPSGYFGLPNLAASPAPIPGGVWCIKVV